MKIQYAGSTHVGMKRTDNEDNLYLLPEEDLYVVADGMGGHASGEVASQIAVETVANFFIDTTREPESTWPHKEDRRQAYAYNRLGNGIKLANRRVYEKSQSDPSFKGMGTTIVGMLLNDDKAYIGHVGDSRGYLITSSGIEQLTSDHSLLNDYLKMHTLTNEEIDNFPHKNVIVRALGMKPQVEVDILERPIQPGEVYLMCSDGLCGMVTDDDICEIVRANQTDLDVACQQLIAAANDNGGIDNVTAVLVRVDA